MSVECNECPMTHCKNFKSGRVMELLNSKSKVVGKELVNVKIEDCPKKSVKGWFDLEFKTDYIHLGS